MIPKGVPKRRLACHMDMRWLMVASAITTVLQPAMKEKWFALVGLVTMDAKWNLTIACQVHGMAMDGIPPKVNPWIVLHSVLFIATGLMVNIFAMEVMMDLDVKCRAGVQLKSVLPPK